MTSRHRYGYHFYIPEDWSRPFVRYWVISSLCWSFAAFLIPVRWQWGLAWVVFFGILFGIPEYLSVKVRNDRYPPLTHTIRHFLPNEAAFPILFGLPAAASSRWLGVEPGLACWRIVFVGVAFAVLGWLTTHFTVTFARPDPHPHHRRRSPSAPEEPGPMIAADGAVPLIPDPHPK